MFNRKKSFFYLKKMWEIRIFEEIIKKMSDNNEIYGTTHLCIGQEATAVGAASIINRKDFLISTHRNHGHSIAKGINIKKMFSEILGKKSGLSSGKAGSMHICDIDIGHLCSNGIVGGGFPISVGVGLASKLNFKNKRIVLCYGGDASINEGSFHEALNLASIWKLPIIYFIENNMYGISSFIKKMVNIENLFERRKAYGINGFKIDGNDLELIIKTIKLSIKKIKKENKGPILIEALTYRHMGHSRSDKLLYRSIKESNFWKKKKNDPIFRWENKMLKYKLGSFNEFRKLELEIRNKFINLVNFIKKNDLYPNINELWLNVYK